MRSSDRSAGIHRLRTREVDVVRLGSVRNPDEVDLAGVDGSAVVRRPRRPEGSEAAGMRPARRARLGEITGRGPQAA